MTTRRLSELIIQPIRGSFDLEHLKKIHEYIFQDVYPFSGKIRNEDIEKDGFTFARCQYIESEAKSLFYHLLQEKCLKGISLELFSERAAHYMAEINVLHPFREGNGRTQRGYIRGLASNAGYQLDWSTKEAHEVFKASVKSKFDTKALAEIIRSSTKVRSIQLNQGRDIER